ncbi:MAG: hypothetical protein KIS67_18690 [Verrucomicrobiae bacterium]|nr:hypothetical protein [Verrucomicrobiae bacterium]
MIEEMMIHGCPAGLPAAGAVAHRSGNAGLSRQMSGRKHRLSETPRVTMSDPPETGHEASSGSDDIAILETPIFRAPPGWSGPMRVSPRCRIELDTPILPELLADGVCEEVTAWLGLPTPLPRRWVLELAGYANTVYAHSERFRRRVRGGGDRGRDQLQAFMRHWLAALLRSRRPDLFARLPADYCIGSDLPEGKWC